MPRLVDGLEQVFTDLGIIGAGYKLFFFETTTTTPKDTFSDVDLTIANPNPVVCDSTGRPEHDIWGEDPSTYKMILGTPDSVIGNINPIVTVDPVNDLNSGSIIIIDPLPTAYWGLTTGTSLNYVLDPALVPITSYSYKQCFFIDFHIACVASPTLNINNLGALNLKKYTGQGTKISLQAGDVQPQRYIAINDGTDIVILNPEIIQNLYVNSSINGGVFAKPVIISNNALDPNNDIDFSSGSCFDQTNKVGWYSTGITKRLDAVWSAGNNNGGLDTGTKAINTWYHTYEIYNPISDLSDAIFSTNPTAPNLPSGYSRFSRVRAGQFLTDGSGNIIPFFSNGFITYFATVRQAVSLANPGTSAVLSTLPVPLGIKTYPIAQYIMRDITPAADRFGLFTSPQQTNSTPSSSLFTNQTKASSEVSTFSGLIETNTSSQIRSRFDFSDADISLIILVSGWIDYNT